VVAVASAGQYANHLLSDLILLISDLVIKRNYEDLKRAEGLVKGMVVDNSRRELVSSLENCGESIDKQQQELHSH